MKIGRELKAGDICYAVGPDGKVDEVKVKEIEGTNVKHELHIIFDNKCHGHCYESWNYSNMGMFDCTVYFDIESVKLALEKKSNFIMKEYVRMDELEKKQKTN